MQTVLFVQPPKDKQCVLCFEDATPTDPRKWIAHEFTGGKNHPIHFVCGREWFIRKQTCPTCRVGMNVYPLLGILDRIRLIYNSRMRLFDTIAFAFASVGACMQPFTSSWIYSIFKHSVWEIRLRMYSHGFFETCMAKHASDRNIANYVYYIQLGVTIGLIGVMIALLKKMNFQVAQHQVDFVSDDESDSDDEFVQDVAAALDTN